MLKRLLGGEEDHGGPRLASAVGQTHYSRDRQDLGSLGGLLSGASNPPSSSFPDTLSALHLAPRPAGVPWTWGQEGDPGVGTTGHDNTPSLC